MFFIIIGMVVGIFIEQTYSLPKLRDMKCFKRYGEPEPEPDPEPEPEPDPDDPDTAHTD